jgi:hypothetical protein
VGEGDEFEAEGTWGRGMGEGSSDLLCLVGGPEPECYEKLARRQKAH